MSKLEEWKWALICGGALFLFGLYCIGLILAAIYVLPFTIGVIAFALIARSGVYNTWLNI